MSLKGRSTDAKRISFVRAIRARRLVRHVIELAR